MELHDIKLVSNDYTDHTIKYYIKNNDAMLQDISIDYNDVKTFASMLMDFCSNMHKNKIKYIRQLASKEDCDLNKQMFSEFKIIQTSDTVVELVATPQTFPSAMFKGLGLNCPGEDNTDKKF